ncbi:putative protein isoform X3 [Capsicum galapagoense]
MLKRTMTLSAAHEKALKSFINPTTKKSISKEKEQALNNYGVEQCVDIEPHLRKEV